MDEKSLHTLRRLIARLERISADSVVAHRASGVRSAMLRTLHELETSESISKSRIEKLIESGYELLHKAAEERLR